MCGIATLKIDNKHLIALVIAFAMGCSGKEDAQTDNTKQTEQAQVSHRVSSPFET